MPEEKQEERKEIKTVYCEIALLDGKMVNETIKKALEMEPGIYLRNTGF